MKKISRDDLKINAGRMIAAHKKEKVFATQDGNIFFNHHDAINHNGSLKKGTEWDGEVFTFTKEEFAEAAKPKAPGKSQAELDKEKEIAAADKAVKDAGKILTKASNDYTASGKKLDKKPTDEALKKANEDAKSAMEAAQLALDNAKTALQALSGN